MISKYGEKVSEKAFEWIERAINSKENKWNNPSLAVNVRRLLAIRDARFCLKMARKELMMTNCEQIDRRSGFAHSVLSG